jgi:hypothetical protein
LDTVHNTGLKKGFTAIIALICVCLLLQVVRLILKANLNGYVIYGRLTIEMLVFITYTYLIEAINSANFLANIVIVIRIPWLLI